MSNRVSVHDDFPLSKKDDGRTCDSAFVSRWRLNTRTFVYMCRMACGERTNNNVNLNGEANATGPRMAAS